MRTQAKYLFYLAAMVLVWLFVKQLDMDIVMEHYNKMGWHFYGILSISLVAYSLSTIGWMLCVDMAFDWRKFYGYFQARLLGECLSVINPTGVVAGDALKVHVMAKIGERKGRVVESVTISRVLLWVSFVLVLILTLMVFSIATTSSFVLVILISFLASIMAGGLLLFLFHPDRFIYKTTVAIQRFLKWDWLALRLNLVSTYNYNTVKMWITHRHKLMLAIFLFGLHYLAGAMEFQYILWTLDNNIEFSAAVYLEVATSFLRSAVAFVPGQIGVEEYGNKLFLTQLGVTDESIWITVSLIRRLRQVIWISLAILSYHFYFKQRKATHTNTKNSAYGSLVH